MKEMFLEFQSKFEFDTTVSTLVEKIEQANWKVQAIHDMKRSLKNKGYDVQPATVVELCNPDIAYKILSKSDERVFSSMMPCRISIYEKSDGKTYISLMNNGAMAQQIGGVVEDAMSFAFEKSMEFVKNVIK